MGVDGKFYAYFTTILKSGWGEAKCEPNIRRFNRGNVVS